MTNNPTTIYKIHVILAMSGQGTRYQKAGYKEPKPLIPVNGIPMVERLLFNFPKEWGYTFVLAENHAHTNLPSTLKKLRPNGEILYLPPHKEGPGKAIEVALEKSELVKKHVGGLLVSYCDYAMVWDPFDFQNYVTQTDCDACLVSYRGFHAHYASPQMYAYSRLSSQSMVLEVKEKGCFTEDREQEFASCGAYYFRNQEILHTSLIHQRSKPHLILNGELYTSLTTQAWIECHPNANVRIYEIPYFFQWGTPQDLSDFEYWERTWLAKLKNQKEEKITYENLLVLMPMAGSGKRIIESFACEKPLLNIHGNHMFQVAMSSLPLGRERAVLCLDSIKSKLETILNASNDSKTHVFSISKTPEGQALSTLFGLEQYSREKQNIDKEIFVSSCDHEIVFSSKKFQNLITSESCDAAIFCIRNYPGVRKNPKSFAYVETIDNEEHETFPIIKKVHVKQERSSEPEKDRLLVGSFWFKKMSLIEDFIHRLVEKNLRVNNELYLDSVFNLMIEEKWIVRCFDLEGYINYGDTDSLKQALYWEEVFSRTKGRPRQAFDGIEKKTNQGDN